MLEETLIVFVKRQKNNFFSRLSKENVNDVVSHLDKQEAYEFLKKQEVEKDLLKKEFEKDDFMTYPLLFIDYDRKKLVSSYSEMDYAFEQTCAKSFVGIYANCLNLIPNEFKYWE